MSEEKLTPSGDDQTRYSASAGLANFMRSQGISLAFTSYQSGKLYFLGHTPQGGLHVHERVFGRAMGLAVSSESLWLATDFQLVRFENALDRGQFANDIHDACFCPRETLITGGLDLHDVGVLKDGGIIFVNTLHNCLSVPSRTKSFRPVWKPPFISQIVAEDRCHLNGLAMHDGAPRYVTAVSRSNTIDGWRDRRDTGGVAIDVESNNIVAESLSMPHSPRIHDDRLWLLNSGTGELGWVDQPRPSKEAFQPVAFCPGFLRGLAFHKNYAVLGLSKPRYQRFEGLSLDARLTEADSEPWCGSQIIDLTNGRCVGWFRIDGATSELYDVAILPGYATPMATSFASDGVRTFITHEPLNALSGTI